MASLVYQYGLSKVLDGTIDLDTSVLKLMLVKSTYVPDNDHTAVSSIPEIAATNYTAGYGGSGRKTAVVTISVDNATNKVIVTIGDKTWLALGGGTNDTITGVALIFETGGSDATAIPIAFFDHTDVTTNGGDFTEDFATSGAGGNIQLAC